MTFFANSTRHGPRHSKFVMVLIDGTTLITREPRAVCSKCDQIRDWFICFVPFSHNCTNWPPAHAGGSDFAGKSFPKTKNAFRFTIHERRNAIEIALSLHGLLSSTRISAFIQNKTEQNSTG